MDTAMKSFIERIQREALASRLDDANEQIEALTNRITKLNKEATDHERLSIRARRAADHHVRELLAEREAARALEEALDATQ